MWPKIDSSRMVVVLRPEKRSFFRNPPLNVHAGNAGAARRHLWRLRRTFGVARQVPFARPRGASTRPAHSAGQASSSAKAVKVVAARQTLLAHAGHRCAASTMRPAHHPNRHLNAAHRHPFVLELGRPHQRCRRSSISYSSRSFAPLFQSRYYRRRAATSASDTVAHAALCFAASSPPNPSLQRTTHGRSPVCGR